MPRREVANNSGLSLSASIRQRDRNVTGWNATYKESREKEFLTGSAEKRYRMLIDRSPELFDKVTRKKIARYLGIAPVALS